MKCPYCGTKLTAGSGFCGVCGAPIQKKAKKNRVSAKVIVIPILSVLILSALVVAGVYLKTHTFNPVNNAITAIESGDFDTAAEIYDEKISGDSDKRKKLADEVVTYLNTCQENFLNESMDYNQICTVIDGITALDLRGTADTLETLTAFVEEINTSRTAYKTAEEFYTKQDYGSALGYYSQVSYNDTYYDDAQTKYTECVSTYREQVLSDAETAANGGDYATALTKLKDGLAILPDDSELNAKYEVYTAGEKDQSIQTQLDLAKSYYSSGDYVNALDTLKSLLRSNDSSEAQQLYDTYLQEYANSAVAAADAAFATGGYSAAVSTLEGYDSVLKESDTYTEKLSYYRSLAPDLLSQQEKFGGNDWYGNGSTTDSLGNNYTDALVFNGGLKNREIEYYINGKYTSVSGVLAMDHSARENASGYIAIYGDDVLLYTSPEITRKTEAFSFNVSMSGVKYLKIQFVRTMDDYANILLADVTLNKY